MVSIEEDTGRANVYIALLLERYGGGTELGEGDIVHYIEGI